MNQLTNRVKYLLACLQGLERDPQFAEKFANDDDFRMQIDLIKGHLQGLDTKPYRIGVMGPVATGKSTFLNKLLGGPVLASGMGATTAVPTEIAKGGDEKFTATIYYKRRSDLRSDLEYYLLAVKEDPTSKLCQEIKDGILALFLNIPNPRLLANADVLPTLNNLETFWPYLEREPLVIKHDTREALGLAIRDHLTDVAGAHGNVSVVVKKVVVTGPFENIPEGVVLVDTPGLGDAELTRSFRTTSIMEDMNEIWMLSSSNQLFALREEVQSLKRITQFDRIRIGLVATYAADSFNNLGEENQEHKEESMAIIRANLRRAYSSVPLSNLANVRRIFEAKCPGIPPVVTTDFFAHFPFANDEAFTQVVSPLPVALQSVIYDFYDRLSKKSFTFDDLPSDCQTEIDASIGRLDIGFTELGADRTLGLEKWIAKLNAIATEKRERILTVINNLHQLLEQNTPEGDLIDDFTSLDTWCGDVTGALHNMAASLEDHSIRIALKDVARSARWQGGWDEYHWKTCRATMDYSRSGVFTSTTGKSRRINLNRDINAQFSQAITRPLRAALRPNFRDLDQIVFTSDYQRSLLMIERQALLDSFTRIKDNYFDSYESSIREFKRDQGIYRDERTDMTTAEETLDVLRNLLVPRLREGIRLLQQIIRGFSTRLHAPQRRFSDEDVAILIGFFAFEGPFRAEPDDDNLVDPISFERFTNPVQFFCRCRIARVVDRTTLMRLTNCFYCRDPIDHTAAISRHDIRAKIHLLEAEAEQNIQDYPDLNPPAWVARTWAELMVNQNQNEIVNGMANMGLNR